MPFWKHASPEEEQRKPQSHQEAEASLHSLQAGGLPAQAQRRLGEETAGDHKLFTSDLSVNEFLLARSQGYQPVGQVMGSSIYHVGWQNTPNSTYTTNEYELTVLSKAHQHAAQLALSRLEQEAGLLKAHGVIGVHFDRRNYEWGQDLVEYSTIGTAIRLPNAPLSQSPFLSDLSGQEFWTLLQAGYYPAGLVTGYCSYFVSLGNWATSQMRGWWGTGGNNQEIVPFSQALYTARDIAMYRLTTMARNLKATGIVGMHIDANRQITEYEREREYSANEYYMDLSVHFSAIGTAITEQKKDHVIPTPKPTLSFTDLRPGRYGQTRELILRE